MGKRGLEDLPEREELEERLNKEIEPELDKYEQKRKELEKSVKKGPLQKFFDKINIFKRRK